MVILDATAGNRTMWINKNAENIIYIDVQTQLERKPTVFCDNTNTPFQDKTFDTIFYDPPHAWGEKHHFYCFPKWTEEYYNIYKDKATPRYYGWERYKSRSELIMHIYRANEEFFRIIKDDGLLWLKWNELSIPMHNILTLFNQWKCMLQIYVKSPSQTAGEHQTFWICLQKGNESSKQTIL